MEQIVFPVPGICQFLTEETKHRLFTTTEQDEQGSKVSDFFDQSSFLHNEMEWQRKLRSEDPAGRQEGGGGALEPLTDAPDASLACWRGSHPCPKEGSDHVFLLKWGLELVQALRPGMGWADDVNQGPPLPWPRHLLPQACHSSTGSPAA